jgi:hypothetical protein
VADNQQFNSEHSLLEGEQVKLHSLHPYNGYKAAKITLKKVLVDDVIYDGSQNRR